ncbi:MAG: aminotransferase class V-fold PLP-dependent enzyme [Planctomycetota bacterium]|jgi:selenocysteine lyase/cysteine desulfurase
MMDIKKIRKEFPVTKKYTYLDNACMGPLSDRATNYMNNFTENMSQCGGVNEGWWVEDVYKTRVSVARLLNADPSEIAFVKNTSEGISFVANGVEWSINDNVIITDVEFPANVYPWMNLRDRWVKVKSVPEDEEGRISFEKIEKAVDEQTRVISVSFVEFTSGFRNDLKRIGELCRKNNIIFVVDAIQGLGALSLDVNETGIDFLAADGHKWLLSPEGVGIFYARKGSMEKLLVHEVGWASVADKEDYLDYNLTLRPDATRFECGSLNTVGIYGLKGSLEVIHEVGIKNVETWILGLTDYLVEKLERKGYGVFSSREDGEKSGIVSFYSEQHNLSRIHSTLASKGVIVSLRDSRIRVSPHFYNTHEDIDKLLKYLP